MLKVIRLIIIFCIIIGAVWAISAGLRSIPSERMIVIEDRYSKEALAVYGPSAYNVSFIWQALIPCLYTVREVSLNHALTITARVVIPELSNLKEDYFRCEFPLLVRLKYDKLSYIDYEFLSNNSKLLKHRIKRDIENAIGMELSQYFGPVYRRDAILADSKIIIEKSLKKAAGFYSGTGISISAEISGPIALPDLKLYNEGLVHSANIRRLDQELEKENRSFSQRLAIERRNNAEWFLKLNQISKIIRNNPEILKYIYIDKLGPNVSLILSSDISGVPRMIEESARDKFGKKMKKQEIDNLR
jgi:hypothetical protein